MSHIVATSYMIVMSYLILTIGNLDIEIDEGDLDLDSAIMARWL